MALLGCLSNKLSVYSRLKDLLGKESVDTHVIGKTPLHLEVSFQIFNLDLKFTAAVISAIPQNLPEPLTRKNK